MNLDEKTIKNTLKHYNELSKQIHQQIIDLQRELNKVEEQAIEIAAYPKTNLNEKIGNSGQHKDLTDIYLKYQKIMNIRQKEIMTEIMWLTAKSEYLYRLYVCSQAISGDGYEIITRIYVQNEKYKTVEMESGLSHRIFEQKRQQAIQDIQKLYESQLTNQQIIELQKRHNHNTKKRKKVSNDTYEQLKFEFN